MIPTVQVSKPSRSQGGLAVVPSVPYPMPPGPENAVGWEKHTDKGAFLSSFNKRLSSIGQPWTVMPFELGLPSGKPGRDPFSSQTWGWECSLNRHEETCCSSHWTLSHPCCPASRPLCSPHGQLPRCPPAYCASPWKSENLGQLIQVESVILLS